MYKLESLKGHKLIKMVLCQVVLVTSKTNDKMNCMRGSKFDLLLICFNRI